MFTKKFSSQFQQTNYSCRITKKSVKKVCTNNYANSLNPLNPEKTLPIHSAIWLNQHLMPIKIYQNIFSNIPRPVVINL